MAESDAPDLIVVGGGHHGLVLANAAADAGWDVLVLEAAEVCGGAVRSDPLTGVPGVIHDTYSSVYPLTLASPAMQRLRLTEHGLVWRQAPVHNVHLIGDGRAAALHPAPAATAAALEAVSPGEGEAWTTYADLGARIGPALLGATLGPLGGLAAPARLAWAARAEDRWACARLALASVRTLGDDVFVDEPARAMLCGLAMHVDLAPEAIGTGIAASLLAWSAQMYGWPVPEGGAGRLAQAMVTRLQRAGGRIRTGAAVTRIVTRRGRVVAVRCADGTEFTARRAVASSATAPTTFLRLLDERDVGPQIRARLARWRSGGATFKLDWVLDGAAEWTDPSARVATTVHLGDSVDEMSRYANEIQRGLLPDRPFVLLGQPSVADPTRAPAGRSVLWAYTHVPRVLRGDAAGVLTPGDGAPIGWDGAAAAFADRIEDRIEAHAPGFRDAVVARHIMTPARFGPTATGADTADGVPNANVAGGDISAGSMDLTQQLVFRPLPGMFRYRTPVRGLYLCAASAHPGGGVHGAAGANAWRAIHADAVLRRI